MKVCDHLETAYWFYLDFLRPDDPSLPACNFEEFLATGIIIIIIIVGGASECFVLTHGYWL